jgi:hypothetical protein
MSNNMYCKLKAAATSELDRQDGAPFCSPQRMSSRVSWKRVAGNYFGKGPLNVRREPVDIPGTAGSRNAILVLGIHCTFPKTDIFQCAGLPVVSAVQRSWTNQDGSDGHGPYGMGVLVSSIYFCIIEKHLLHTLSLVSEVCYIYTAC